MWIGRGDPALKKKNPRRKLPLFAMGVLAAADTEEQIGSGCF
jgi:hypothetical protein